MNTHASHIEPVPEERASFQARPPRIELGAKLSDDVLWITAIDWVAMHRKAIVRAGRLVLKTRRMESDDLLQVARIVAFTQCRRVAGEGQIENFVPLFFSHLRSACLAEWQRHHHEVLADLDWDNVPAPDTFLPEANNERTLRKASREHALRRALALMTARQREICAALLGLGKGEGRLSQQETADRLKIDRTTVSRTVDAACRRVTRQMAAPPQNPAPNQAQQPESPTSLEERLAAAVAENQRLRGHLITLLCDARKGSRT
jgi:RNA polymerase sigma factor (sigma-70 family)